MVRRVRGRVVDGSKEGSEDMSKLDLTYVRSQFPAFSVPGLKDQSFFENAGGSYACAPVIDRLTRFYRERKVQPYAPYAAARAGGAEMDEARHLDTARLAPLLSDGKVRLVCFPHCSNVVAEINPVADIARLAHAAGAVVCVDGVSYAPHGLPDVGALGADIYLFSAYKVYGPHQGIMVIREDLGMRLPNQGHYFNGETLYKRFTPAGPDHAQVAASAGMADYFDGLHAHHFAPEADPAKRGAAVHDLLRAHEVAVCQPLLDYLAARNDLRLIGPRDAARRAPTVAVALDRAAEPVSEALAREGINCWAGDFYAVRPLTAMGVDLERGVLRLSMVHYTVPDDVTRLITALDRVL